MLLPFLLVANAAMSEDKTPSGTVTIDETQIMWMVGGSIGGGTFNYQGKTCKFKLQGDVFDLKNVADFAGVYGEAARPAPLSPS
jgi:hypothetical protein